MIVVLSAPLDHNRLGLPLLLIYWEMQQAILRTYAWSLSWLFYWLIICAVYATHHSRNFLFFKHFYVYLVDDVPPENLLFVWKFLFRVTALFLGRLWIEVFGGEVDWARFWPWLLDLAFFLHLLVLALRSIFLVRLFSATGVLQHLVCTLVVHCLFHSSMSHTMDQTWSFR